MGIFDLFKRKENKQGAPAVAVRQPQPLPTSPHSNEKDDDFDLESLLGKPPRAAYYHFVHTILKMQTFKLPYKIYYDLINEREQVLEMLVNQTNYLCKNMGKPVVDFSAQDICVYDNVEVNGLLTVALAMPEPRYGTEAAFVVIILNVSQNRLEEIFKNDESEDAIRPYYYTLEFMDTTAAPNRFALCQWTEGSHSILQEGLPGSINAILQAIGSLKKSPNEYSAPPPPLPVAEGAAFDNEMDALAQKPTARAAHYLFAHVVLRRAFTNDALAAFVTLSLPRLRLESLGVLVDEVKQICSGSGEPPPDFTAKDFEVHDRFLVGHCPALVVELPPAKYGTEAAFVVVIMSATQEKMNELLKQGDAPPDAITARYYTLERVNTVDDRVRYALCQWEGENHSMLEASVPCNLDDLLQVMRSM